MLIATIRWQLCQTVIETFLPGIFLIAKLSELLHYLHRFSIYVFTQRKQQPNMLGGNSFDQKVGISVQSFNLHKCFRDYTPRSDPSSWRQSLPRQVKGLRS